MGDYTLEFYTDPSGRQPAREWMQSLSPAERRAVGVALHYKLQRAGIGVCEGRDGKQLGGGLFELRVQESGAAALRAAGAHSRTERDRSRLLLRVFCHAHGDRVVLILGGYDKLRDPSPRRQQREILTARDRLTSFRSHVRQQARRPPGLHR